MNEMINRVAKAIALRDTTDEFAMARAAIEAMREPTDKMLSAADYSGSLEEGSSALGCWQAMIDEALK